MSAAIEFAGGDVIGRLGANPFSLTGLGNAA